MGLTLALVMFVGAGCYTRVQLPKKATPAATTIRVHFTVNEDLVQAPFEMGEQGPGVALTPAEQADAERWAKMLAALAPQMERRMEADLVNMRIGVPVVSQRAEADLELTGEFRRDVFGVALDWRLTEVDGDRVVAAGIAMGGAFEFNADRFADAVLMDLLKPSLNIDGYASRPAAPAAAPPAAAAPAAGPLVPRPSATDGSNTWAVVIGIETYRDALPPATFAEADARAFKSYAHTTLGVPEDHIKLLVGNRAGRGDLASALEEWLPRNAVTPGGRVYVFFSGHGAPDIQTGDAYLVPWDGDPAYLKTRGYAVSNLYAKLGALKNQEIFVFLDACFSGAGGRSVLAQGTRPLVPVRTAQPTTGIISFAAASASEATGAAPGGQHGLFTHHLLTALSGKGDTNGDGNITLAELTGYVATQVERDARKDNREQRPTLVAPRGLRADEVVLVEGLAP
jgi:hypothetical protein